MAATVTARGTTWNTTAGDKTVVATPAVGDLIVVIAAATGVATTAVTDTQSGVYVKVDSDRTGFSTTGTLNAWVRTALIPAASSTTWTATQTSSTGGGLTVISVSGMTLLGAAAVRSSGGQSSGTTGTTPAPVLSLTPLTTNPVITAIANGTNGSANATPRTGYTEDTDLGYNTPTTGIEVSHRASGETSATITYGSTTPSAFASIALELQFNSAPTVALNAPADTGTVTTTTPQVTFTGTDADSDAVTYEVQVGTSATMPSTIDVYDTSNRSSGSNLVDPTSALAIAQSITGTGKAIGSIRLAMEKFGSPTGNAVVKIFAHSGTFGTSSVGTGSALATSDNFNVANLTTTYADYIIQFSGGNQITLTNTTKYVFALEWTSPADSVNFIQIGTDTTSPTHAGNLSHYTNGGTWTASSGTDLLFELQSADGLIIDRLSVTDVGFTDITNGAHTDPFTSGEQIGYTVQTVATTVDSYSETNVDTGQELTAAAASYQKSGQSFHGVTGQLGSAKFYLKRHLGTPSGNMFAELYAHSGTFGSTSVPTGSALATSDAVNASSLSGSYQLVTFTFSAGNQYSMSAGTDYVIVFNNSINDGANTVDAGVDQSSPTHAGSGSLQPSGGGAWQTTTQGLAFYVYTVAVSPLSNGNTYYWRVRGKDPSGTNGYGAWATTRSFLVGGPVVSDTATITENASVAIVGGSSDLGINKSDSLAVTESVRLVLNSFVNKSDNVTVTEALTMLLISMVAVSDTSTITESLALLNQLSANVSDTATTTESVAVLIPTLLVATSDSSTVAESLVKLLTSFVTTSESVTITESQQANLSNDLAVSDSASLTESVTVLNELNVRVSDSSSTAESLTMLVPSLLVQTSDSVTATETLALLVTSFVSISNSATVTESLTVTIAASTDLSVTVSDSITITESVGRLLLAFVAASDSTTVSESLLRALNSTVSVSDSPTVAEATTATLTSNVAVSDNTALTELTKVELNSFVSKSDSATATDSVTLLVPTLMLAVSDSTSITESFAPLLTSLVSASDTVSATEALARLLTSFVAISDTVTVTEALSLLTESYVNKSESVTITESVAVVAPGAGLSIAVNDTLTATESTSAALSVSISTSDPVSVAEALQRLLESFVSKSESVTISESLQRLLELTVQVSDSAAISESVTARPTTHVLAVSDSITITENVSAVPATLSLSVFDVSAITESIATVFALTVGDPDDPAVWIVSSIPSGSVSAGSDSTGTVWVVDNNPTETIDEGSDSASGSWTPSE